MADDRTEVALARLRELRVLLEEESDEALRKTRHEQRVDEIVGMMCGGAWVTGTSHRQLAQFWGCSVDRVEVCAAEANRVIRRYLRESPEDKKETLARLVQSLERIAQKAEARGSTRGYRDAIAAYTMLADLHGLRKHHVEFEDSNSPFSGWTREEKLHFSQTGERPTRLTREDEGD